MLFKISRNIILNVFISIGNLLSDSKSAKNNPVLQQENTEAVTFSQDTSNLL